jgi:molybdopterin converting factor small subunit
LLQRMKEVTYMGKLANLSQKLERTEELMKNNIDQLLARETKLEKLQEESTQLQQMAEVFQKKSEKVKRMQMMNNAKHGVMLGTAVTAGVAVVVVPPLIVLL